MITGLNAKTGRSLTDKAHLQQSISDILFTPIGSRVMRRDYGSDLFELIDQAGNDAGRLRLMAASAGALMQWEPRLQLNKVTVDLNKDGEAIIEVTGIYQGSDTTFSVNSSNTTDTESERYKIWQSIKAAQAEKEKPADDTNVDKELQQGTLYYDIANGYVYIAYGKDSHWLALRYSPETGDKSTGLQTSGIKPSSLAELQALTYN